MVEWIRTPQKEANNCSIIWKTIINSFHVIGDGLAWKIGDGSRAHVGMDPWPDSQNSHILPPDLVQQLHEHGFIYLNQIVDGLHSNIWSQEWKGSTLMGLNEVYTETWNEYINALKIDHIRITEREDELVWQGTPNGAYTPKLGYTMLNVGLMQRDPIWYWKGLWKVKCPLKARMFMWGIINNKAPLGIKCTVDKS